MLKVKINKEVLLKNLDELEYDSGVKYNNYRELDFNKSYTVLHTDFNQKYNYLLDTHEHAGDCLVFKKEELMEVL